MKKLPATSLKPARKASSAAHEEPQNDSVFDFLYQDARRIGSFLAQFDDSGHLQEVTQGDTAAKGKRASYKVELTGGFGEAMGLPGAGVALERNPGEAGSFSSQRTYDPLWTNARTLLDYLAAADLIERDATRAAIGHFVLVTGQLFVADTALLRTLSEGPLFRRHIRGDTQTGKHANRKSTTSDTDVGIEMFQSMPMTVQARVITDTNDTFWGGLQPDGLTASPGEIMMKHGFQVAGDWSLLGILDAVPESALTEQEVEIQNAITIATLGPLVGSLAVMATVARPIMGRPNNAFGVTPLLVFREIAARSAS